jgi:hypothetical protein
MRLHLLTTLLCLSFSCGAQELYSATEPASNIASKSIVFRLDNSIMDEINSSKINYHLIPELGLGISKMLMVRANVFFSNRTEVFRMEGGSIYAKYRFLSRDAVQKHFRMAIYGRLSSNNSDVHQQEINMNGHNSGYELGLVATQLLRKVAVSSSLTLLRAKDNGKGNKFIYSNNEKKAMNYTFSIGKLMLPKEYRSYGQTNVNLMIECISQLNFGSGAYYIDIAPTVQMVIRSQGILDIGYRKQVASTLLRTAPNGFFIRVEYNLFDAL